MALGKNQNTRESALRLEAFSAPVAALENPKDCFFSRGGNFTRKKSFAPGRFDPEGAKTPEGERKLAAQPAKQAGDECNGLEARMQPGTGANQQLAAEPKSRTGRKTGKRVSEVAGQEH